MAGSQLASWYTPPTMVALVMPITTWIANKTTVCRSLWPRLRVHLAGCSAAHRDKGYCLRDSCHKPLMRRLSLKYHSDTLDRQCSLPRAHVLRPQQKTMLPLCNGPYGEELGRKLLKGLFHGQFLRETRGQKLNTDQVFSLH